jgi:hypothetical protein
MKYYRCFRLIRMKYDVDEEPKHFSDARHLAPAWNRPGGNALDSGVGRLSRRPRSAQRSCKQARPVAKRNRDGDISRRKESRFRQLSRRIVEGAELQCGTNAISAQGGAELIAGSPFRALLE